MKTRIAALVLCLAGVVHAAAPKQQPKTPAIVDKPTATVSEPSAQQIPTQKRTDFFPISSWYSGGKARAPMLEPISADSEQRWREDLLKLKGLGFNTVRTWVEWGVGNPKEGVYKLDNLDLMLKLAEEQGLKVIVQVYVDSAPEWVGKKYPDGHFIAQNGAKIPTQSAPGYCFDHPGVREAILEFFQEVGRHTSKSPAFWGWDLWSEPHVINWAELQDVVPNGGMFCYCPNSIARFRGWLNAKYGSLDALNKAWYRQFESWSDVEPPRFGTILTYVDYMDWRVYTADKIAQDLKSRNMAVKEVDPWHVTTSHSDSSPFHSISNGWGVTDDFLMKDSVDVYGTSFYPKLTTPATHFNLPMRAFVMDAVRAVTADRGFYVGELQGGYGVHGVIASDPITPEEIVLYTWGMVSRGARAINYYAFYPMSTGYEAGGYGLINLDGTLTERSKRAGATAKIIHANADLLLQAKPVKAEAAVIYNPLTSLVGGFNFGDRRAMRDAVRGYHAMFFERNIPLDMLSSREVTSEKLKQYKLVIVPDPIMMTESLAKMLEQYVVEGGHMFTEARPGWVDEMGHGQAIPAFGWMKMLGVREDSVTPRSEFRVKWGTDEFLGMGFEERFIVLDSTAKVVATFEDGTPAAYERQHGKGKAMILGGFAGQMNIVKPLSNHPLLPALAKWAGLSMRQLKTSAPVELREESAPNGHLVFVLNHGKTDSQVEFTTALAKPARRVVELTQNDNLQPQGAQFQLNITVPAESVRVYRVDY